MEESSVHSCPVPEGHPDGPLSQLPDMPPAEECLDTGYEIGCNPYLSLCSYPLPYHFVVCPYLGEVISVPWLWACHVTICVQLDVCRWDTTEALKSTLEPLPSMRTSPGQSAGGWDTCRTEPNRPSTPSGGQPPFASLPSDMWVNSAEAKRTTYWAQSKLWTHYWNVRGLESLSLGVVCWVASIGAIPD